MTLARATAPVHLLVPAGYDDPRRASGGNTYDREIAAGLAGLGRRVVIHEVPHAWPAPGPSVAAAVGVELARIPDDEVVLVDGLLGRPAESQLIQHAGRLPVVLLVHMPGPPGGPAGALMRAARLVVATSAATARTLVMEHGLDPEAVVVATPGAPTAELAAGTPSGVALLSVAAVTKLKGHDVLFAALAALGEREWRCRCVGDLDREPAFVDRQRQALADTAVADRVQLAGPLAGADLGDAYARADLLVLASREESYGLVVTEALARGLPVIASSVGGVAEALGRAADGSVPGILVPPADDRALAAAISAWLDDQQLRERLRAAARSRRDGLPRWEGTVRIVAAAVNRLATSRVPIT